MTNALKLTVNYSSLRTRDRLLNLYGQCICYFRAQKPIKYQHVSNTHNFYSYLEDFQYCNNSCKYEQYV